MINDRGRKLKQWRNEICSKRRDSTHVILKNKYYPFMVESRMMTHEALRQIKALGWIGRWKTWSGYSRDLETFL